MPRWVWNEILSKLERLLSKSRRNWILDPQTSSKINIVPPCKYISVCVTYNWCHLHSSPLSRRWSLHDYADIRNFLQTHSKFWGTADSDWIFTSNNANKAIPKRGLHQIKYKKFILWLCHYYDAVDGGYGPWTKWSKCSKTCGGGTQKRSRRCNKPRPVARGKKCNVLGPNKETQECNTQNCVQCKYLSLIGAMVSVAHRMQQQLRSYVRHEVLL